MDLLRRLREWAPRLRLLFAHPTPTIANRLDTNLGLLERWLLREGEDHSVPSTLPTALERFQVDVEDLKSSSELPCSRPGRYRRNRSFPAEGRRKQPGPRFRPCSIS